MEMFNNEWLMEKIVSYLLGKEGCLGISKKSTSEASEVIIEDVFGYRYEITIKTTGRVRTEISEMERYNGTK